jgi:aspartate aminotransferase
MALFENLEPKPADAILKLIGEHLNDPRPEKADLGVGVYRDADGNTPVLKTVKKAEHWLVGSQTSKAYLGSRGDAQFCEALQDMTFGAGSSDSGRIATLQTPGGSGALRVAAGVIIRARPDATMWVSDPTWNNHTPLLGGAGVRLKEYPYYDTEKHNIRFTEMLTALGNAAAGDLVLLHGCCHNPTGMDLSTEQWAEVTDLVVDRGLVPFIDLAYQGFANGLDADAAGLRQLVAAVPEVLIAGSCSKNLGLYRERTGAAVFVTADPDAAIAAQSQATAAARRIYSMPPAHGAILAGRVLTDARLNGLWRDELQLMCGRINGLRAQLVEKLNAATGADFGFIAREKGMFSFLGISAQQVAQLREEHSVYMVGSSRMNIAGLRASNIDYFAEAVAKVL